MTTMRELRALMRRTWPSMEKPEARWTSEMGSPLLEVYAPDGDFRIYWLKKDDAVAAAELVILRMRQRGLQRSLKSGVERRRQSTRKRPGAR